MRGVSNAVASMALGVVLGGCVATTPARPDAADTPAMLAAALARKADAAEARGELGPALRAWQQVDAVAPQSAAGIEQARLRDLIAAESAAALKRARGLRRRGQLAQARAEALHALANDPHNSALRAVAR